MADVDDKLALLEKRTEAAEAALTVMEGRLATMESVTRPDLCDFKRDCLEDLAVVKDALMQQPARHADDRMQATVDGLRKENAKLNYRITHLLRSLKATDA
ncbi:Uncharacterized protein PBTT_09498 [Plasmodiophora brassicae]